MEVKKWKPDCKECGGGGFREYLQSIVENLFENPIKKADSNSLPSNYVEGLICELHLKGALGNIFKCNYPVNRKIRVNKLTGEIQDITDED